MWGKFTDLFRRRGPKPEPLTYADSPTLVTPPEDEIEVLALVILEQTRFKEENGRFARVHRVHQREGWKALGMRAPEGFWCTPFGPLLDQGFVLVQQKIEDGKCWRRSWSYKPGGKSDRTPWEEIA